MLVQSAKFALPSPSVSYNAHASPEFEPVRPVSSHVHVRLASEDEQPLRPPSFPTLTQNSFRSFCVELMSSAAPVSTTHAAVAAAGRASMSTPAAANAVSSNAHTSCFAVTERAWVMGVMMVLVGKLVGGPPEQGSGQR
jgi:hypothetical protein